jgi:hypothetical protein
MAHAAHFMLDSIERLARLDVDDLLEPVLMLDALFARQPAFEQPQVQLDGLALERGKLDTSTPGIDRIVTQGAISVVRAEYPQS